MQAFLSELRLYATVWLLRRTLQMIPKTFANARAISHLIDAARAIGEA